MFFMCKYQTEEKISVIIKDFKINILFLYPALVNRASFK